MSDGISVLVVDDDEESRTLLRTLLESLGYRVETAAGGLAALERLAATAPGRRIDVVVLDVMMPDLDGLETLKRYRAAGGTRPVLMLSALDEASTAVQAVRMGANDYVTKPFDPEELREILERVAGDAVRELPAAASPAQARPSSVAGPGPVAQSPAMRRVHELIERIADVDVPILVTGESGVGKDVAAREIHVLSTRKQGSFVKINCAALPGELLESELFGHERGSFTGAARTKLGQFELAHGGTLFLDEIGEMPVSLQAKLLQALQDGEFYRVGGQKKIRVDARVIVATNRNLERAIREGSFREDLYYRLNVVHFEIPPLRERREDIPALIEHFVDKYGRRYGRSMEVPKVVMARFLTYDWPGNIRELENLVRRLMVLRDPAYVLTEMRDRAAPQGALAEGGSRGTSIPSPAPAAMQGGLPSTLQSGAPCLSPVVPPSTVTMVGDELHIDLKEVGRQAAHIAEREAIVTMLGHTGGNKREAAERLGISYKAILYKIREFGIGRPRVPRRPTRPGLPVVIESRSEGAAATVTAAVGSGPATDPPPSPERTAAALGDDEEEDEAPVLDEGLAR